MARKAKPPRSQPLAHTTVAMPARVMISDPTRWAAAAHSAQLMRPCCSSNTTSAEKVEKVVSPPQKPVMMKSRHCGDTAVALPATSTP